MPVGSLIYDYDDDGRLETVTAPDGVSVTRYTYDTHGNKASVIYPNGIITEYGYNNLNRLISVETRTLMSDIIASYAYTTIMGQRVKGEGHWAKGIGHWAKSEECRDLPFCFSPFASHLSPFALRLSPFPLTFRLSPFAFRLFLCLRPRRHPGGKNHQWD
jgi:YD repeat-containing protein